MTDKSPRTFPKLFGRGKGDEKRDSDTESASPGNTSTQRSFSFMRKQGEGGRSSPLDEGKRGSSEALPQPTVAKGTRGIESIQKLVSKNKRRFVDKTHNFNLDLSYIGDRIIAMGFPADGKEAAYRNPRSEVLRFLDTFHRDHYKVYNLCSEKEYDPSVFYGRVARFPFDDHNAPPLRLVYECCKDIDAWLKEHPKNIAAIHCKAGKGRTGVIIASWLLYNNEWPDADKALSFYAAARTYNQKGVTIPSQLRYVRYFGDALKRKGGYSEVPQFKPFLLKELVFHDFLNNAGELRFTVQAYVGDSVHLTPVRSWKDHGNLVTAANKKDSVDVSFAMHPPLPLFGDVRIQCAGKNFTFHFWICTAMLSGTTLTLQKAELDKINKDKKKVFAPTFNVQLNYSEDAGKAAPASDQAALAKNPLRDQGRKRLEYRFPTLLNL